MNEGKILWKNRLSVKIPITMATIILIVIVAMCSCLSLLAGTTVTKMTEKELNYIADGNAKEVQSYLDSMLVFSQALNQTNICRIHPMDFLIMHFVTAPA